MKFEIEETIDHKDGNVEVRARLEDGRLAIVTLKKGDVAFYKAGVAAYLAESEAPAEKPPKSAKGRRKG